MNHISSFVEDVNKFDRNDTMVVGLSMMGAGEVVTLVFNGLQVPAVDAHVETNEPKPSAPGNLEFGLEMGGGALAGFIVAASLLRRKHRRS